jgi:predicted transcriptional regulator
MLNRFIDVLRPPLPGLAKQLGISESALYRYRTGSREVPAELMERLLAVIRDRIERLEAFEGELRKGR